MAASLRIEPATPDDVPIILSLIGELAEFEKLRHEMVATEADLRLHLFCERPCAEVLIAREEDQPVGFALFFQSFSTFLGRPGLYLEDLFIRPSFRGHGYGEALLRRLAAIAVERHCGRLEWSVLDWNVRAQEFYRRLGAVAMDGWTVHRVSGEALNRLGETTARRS